MFKEYPRRVPRTFGRVRHRGRERSKARMPCSAPGKVWRLRRQLPKEDRESMSDLTVENLILNLLEWLADGQRSYEEVMGAWRTSCPGLPVWEDANDRGLITMVEVEGRCMVRITGLGFALLGRPGTKNLASDHAV